MNKRRKGLSKADTPHPEPETETETSATSETTEPRRRSARLSLRPSMPVEAATTKVKSNCSRQRPSPSSAAQQKQKSQSVAATAAVGYTSDGMSFEDVTETDDDMDMLPDIVMESPSKERKYTKDDIVWAPHRNAYWPAIVTSVQLPHIRFLYINDSGEHVFRKQAKQLIPFDNSAKNLELKNLGEKNFEEKEGVRFKEAYDLVKKFLMKRKNHSTLSARHFLTLNENDKVAQAKTCLLRLTGSFEGFDNEEDKPDGDMPDHVINSEDEENSTDEPSESNLHTDGRSPNEKAKVEEILRDLETLPSSMTVSTEQYQEMEKEANELLAIIRSTDCFNHLMQIRKGSIMSSRHLKYSKQELVQGGLGPFTLFNDLTNQLLTVLDSHCDEYDSPNYKQTVMLPEAIIYAITKVMGCSKLDAKRHFHRTCQKVGVKDRD